MMQSPKSNRPAAGLLDQRAWTLQERYLARRLIAFVPNCISWVCNTADVTETGQPFSGFGRKESWSILLQEYTTRSLTFASDRIEALRGIAKLYQQYRKDGYIPEYGVWEENLVLQLLWFNNRSCSNDRRLANMLSWSWAATKSSKRWPPEGVGATEWDYISRAKQMPERLVIASSGHLQNFWTFEHHLAGPKLCARRVHCTRPQAF
jgi:hypothetical protein